MKSLWMKIAALLAAATLCAPAVAQDKKISALPAASTLTGPEKLSAVQGSGCATSASPCANVVVTPAQIATYVAGATPITSAYQPLDSDLTALAGIAPANDDVVQRKSGAWVNRTVAQLRSDLGSGYVIHQSAVNSAITGTTTETTLATFTIPANSIGPNGSADILTTWGYTNSANTKNLRVRINGTQVLAITPTTTAGAQVLFSIANRNAANAQVANATGFNGIGTGTGSEQTFSFDTTADLTITITGQLTNTGEEIRLARRRCIIYPGA